MEYFPGSISEIAEIMSNDNGWLSRQRNAADIICGSLIDGEIQGLNVVIYLTKERNYYLAEKLLDKLRLKYRDGGLTFYHSAVVAAGLHDIDKAIFYAGRAVSLSPILFQNRSLLARACAVSGRIHQARDVLRNTLPQSRAELIEFSKLAQFIDLCESYPLSKLKTSLEYFGQTGGYMDPNGYSELILTAIRNTKPFSMVRLGDGEAAWHRFDAYDEGRFSELYRSNRSEFLRDWFGSDTLLESDSFLSYSESLQNTFGSHDLIGITLADRIYMEEGFLSIRGISTTINTFRFLELLNGNSKGKRICSNSINLSLASDTSFYQNMFATKSRFGLITSQPSLAKMMTEKDIDLAYNYLIPGDSRNFHIDGTGSPECQYPNHVNRIDAELSKKDLHGIVFLVAAGYVGKRYLTTIRNRGGIAIDLGSLADHWTRHGIPT